MIAVDTSVWIAFFRGRDHRTAAQLRRLLDANAVALPAPVRVEILSGASRHDFGRLRRLLSALPTAFPTRETWSHIDRWLVRAVAAGEHFGVGDTLIAALAAEHGWSMWSLDGDFARMSELGWIVLYAPG
ncbi:MAG: PIN domain-containing protein [Deltaproteobacteria bacterium]|nr:PIN domain-containing protein [Deltaproteobacteria bacterium]